MPGAAASQNSWLVVNWKPMRGSSTTTTLQTIHTAKDRNSGGIDKIRLRKAMARPCCCQNAASSGRHPVSQRRAARTSTRCSLTIWSRSAGSRSKTAARSPFSAIQVHTIVPATTTYISMNALLRTFVASTAIPNTIGKDKSAKSADDADQPTDGTHVCWIIVGEFTIDAGLANALCKADDEDENCE